MDRLIETVAREISSGRALHSVRHGGAVFALTKSDSGIAKAIIPIIREEVKKELEDFICDDCSTPNFIHIVVPKDYWNSQSPSGVEE